MPDPSVGQTERSTSQRVKLIEMLETKYREFGWDVGGTPPRRGSAGDILTREIDQLADAILEAIDD